MVLEVSQIPLSLIAQFPLLILSPGLAIIVMQYVLSSKISVMVKQW